MPRKSQIDGTPDYLGAQAAVAPLAPGPRLVMAEVADPAALADLGHGDNIHLLCLGTADTAISVASSAGVFVDPNKDLNPETEVAVSAFRSD